MSSCPFTRHGVKHLSASSLNCFRTEPAAWVMRYLWGVKDAGNAAMWRGRAVEAGLDSWLYKRDLDEAKSAALAAFELDAQGETSDEIDAERDMVIPMLEQGIAVAPDDIPIARQVKVETWLDGVEVPLIGYADYVFASGPVDLKSTKRCPSSLETLSQEHVRQVSIYSKARGEPSSLWYVTPKKAARYDIPAEMVEASITDVTRIARSLRMVLARSRSRDEVAELFAPDYDNFYWSDASRDAAKAVACWQF